MLNKTHLTQMVQDCKSFDWNKWEVSSKTTLSLKKNYKGHWKTVKTKEKGENMARERAASWAVWGWERCTLPGTLMNALQASSSPCSPQRSGFHAYANHALQDTTALSWWKETRSTVGILNWLHFLNIHPSVFHYYHHSRECHHHHDHHCQEEYVLMQYLYDTHSVQLQFLFET